MVNSKEPQTPASSIMSCGCSFNFFFQYVLYLQQISGSVLRGGATDINKTHIHPPQENHETRWCVKI